METPPANPFFISQSHNWQKVLSLHNVMLLIASIALWRLKYAFIEEEEYSKEEKTRGKNWEITQISR
jgi:hypothetical protein